nr:AsmA-like C-terminal region-containing protein [Pseudaminobacter manganicus]
MARVLGGVLAVVVILAVAVYALGASGIGTEKLNAEAETAVENMVGFDVEVSVGQAGITLDRSSFLALQVNDVGLKQAGGAKMADAGSVRFGVRLLPLLSGQVRLTSARISDARIVTAVMPSGDDKRYTSLRNTDGLLDPDKVIDAVFASVRDMLDAVRLDSLREIELDNVEFVLPEGEPISAVKVAHAIVSQAGPDKMVASATIALDDKALTLAASAASHASGRITGLQADIAIDAGASARAAMAPALGTIKLHISGTEGEGDQPPKLAASLSLAGSVIDLGRRGLFKADVVADAALVKGTNKIDVGQLKIRNGHSTLNFQGSIGPTPMAGTVGEDPSYRYDFVSNGSTLIPSTSPEPALEFIARIAGRYLPAKNRLLADTIAVKSGPDGEALGTAAVNFVEGEAPGVSVAIKVHNMPVSHVKQLWPWFTAGNARLWVLENLFGGRVTDASLQYQVVPGRAGNGVPLSRDEVFGRFVIDGSRFDTAGRIPPIRDAVGVVEFHGNDVDISLSSGTVYLPSGRVVAASNGTLKIKSANISPVIGALDIDVAGEAPAIAELASYDPINAMRFVGLSPDDFSGTVAGHVKADIPLQSGVDPGMLDWLVSLDYENLSIAEPVDGQAISEADGTITVGPQKAVIAAKARLNGIPAELDLIEPLEDTGPPRSRKVVLVLDDKTRETLMPGLATLLSGTVRVTMEKGTGNGQRASADLTNARLNLPWVGWSKGPGVPAKVAFTLAESNGETRLSGFDLDGQSFAIDGDVVLSHGNLISASFNKVRLNRGDDVDVTIKRTSKGGYDVDVKGAALDARSLIKQLISDGPAAKGVESDPISIDAKVDSLTGFHNEKLSNLKLNYSGTGARVGDLEVSANAASGASITIANIGSADGRKLNMKSADAGAILRFLDVYEHMQGGGITLALSGNGSGPLRGTIAARDFLIVDEPKLASIVSTTPQGDRRSLNQAVKGRIDASRVRFERGFAEIEKGNGYVKLAKGVLRGPLIGTTFQGTLYDDDNNMDLTGTFMPAYGLNRIFGELPLVGALLGNGRDRGLIGVTYRLKGDANKPDLSINPLSVIAPGIFRSIFEFR